MLFDQIETTWLADREVVDQVRSNTVGNFRLVFDRRFLSPRRQCSGPSTSVRFDLKGPAELGPIVRLRPPPPVPVFVKNDHRGGEGKARGRSGRASRHPSRILGGVPGNVSSGARPLAELAAGSPIRSLVLSARPGV